jgi:hypothetical protein
MNEETRQKMSESHKGKTHSPETKAKISASHIQYWKTLTDKEREVIEKLDLILQSIDDMEDRLMNLIYMFDEYENKLKDYEKRYDEPIQ